MALVTRSYKFIGTNNGLMARYVDASSVISASAPSTTLECQIEEDQAIGLDEYMTTLGWVAWAGFAAEAAVIHTMIVASVAGKNNYPIPIGNYVKNAAGNSTLEVDTGSGYAPLVYGTDYTHFLRSSPGTPASVVDSAIGFSYVGSVAAGWTFRFKWKQRILTLPPVSIAKVLVPADYTIAWLSNSANAPNGVTIPEFPGMACEFWRQTLMPAGKRGTSAVLIRSGRRYLPYFRGALGTFTFGITDFSSTQAQKRNRFKVCYYNPVTGARSPLSSNTIVVCGSRADAVNGRIPVRTGRSIWIED